MNEVITENSNYNLLFKSNSQNKQLKNPILELYEAFEMSKNYKLPEEISSKAMHKRDKLKDLLKEVVIIENSPYFNSENHIESKDESSSSQLFSPNSSISSHPNNQIKIKMTPAQQTGSNNTLLIVKPTSSISLDEININNYNDLIKSIDVLNKQNKMSNNEINEIFSNKGVVNKGIDEISAFFQKSFKGTNSGGKRNSKLINLTKLKEEMLDLLRKNSGKKSEEPIKNNFEMTFAKLNEKEKCITKNINKNIHFLQNYINFNESKNSNKEALCDTNKMISTSLIKPSDQINKQTKLIRKDQYKKSFHSLMTTDLSTIQTNNLSKYKLDLLEIHDKDELLKEKELPKKKLNFYSTLPILETKLDSISKSQINNGKRHQFLTNNLTKIKECKLENKHNRYICNRCGLKLKNFALFKKHLISHANLKPYKCIRCSLSFTTKGNLVKHVKTKAHIKQCIDLGMNEHDEEITKLTNENVDTNELNEQLKIQKEMLISEHQAKRETKKTF